MAETPQWPPALAPDLTTVKEPRSAALFGFCRWTTMDILCYGTLLPIWGSLFLLILLLAYGFYKTPQSKVLEELLPPSKSPLLPESFRILSSSDLNSVLSGVNDVPLKSFLPRHDLGDLVEPCAALGVASIRDMLSVNPLGLRDIGVGPKEVRIFSRALERKVKLREAMHEAFSIRGPTVGERTRATLAQRRRENKAKSSGDPASPHM